MFFIQDPHIPNNATFLCPWDGDGGAAEKKNEHLPLFQIAPKMHLPDFFCAATGKVPKRASALLGQNRWQIEGAEKCVWGSPQSQTETLLSDRDMSLSDRDMSLSDRDISLRQSYVFFPDCPKSKMLAIRSPWLASGPY